MEHVFQWSPQRVLNIHKDMENDKLLEQLQPYLMQLHVLYLWFTSHTYTIQQHQKLHFKNTIFSYKMKEIKIIINFKKLECLIHSAL